VGGEIMGEFSKKEDASEAKATEAAIAAARTR
jgi:hypothetical protein